jgi:hypothetical protein
MPFFGLPSTLGKSIGGITHNNLARDNIVKSISTLNNTQPVTAQTSMHEESLVNKQPFSMDTIHNQVMMDRAKAINQNIIDNYVTMPNIKKQVERDRAFAMRDNVNQKVFQLRQEMADRGKRTFSQFNRDGSAPEMAPSKKLQAPPLSLLTGHPAYSWNTPVS